MTVSLLLASVLSSLAVFDTNIVASGEWSKPVANEHGAAIRGRLMICEYPNHRGGSGMDLGVYLELQEYSDFVGEPIDVYCVMTRDALGVSDGGNGLHCELRDSAGKAMPASMAAYGGGAPVSCCVNLQPYSSIRLRASVFGGGKLKDGSLGIWLGGAGGWWTLNAGDTNTYFLSGVFTAAPYTNYVPADFRYIWSGTLKLPGVAISNNKSLPSARSPPDQALKRKPENLTLTLAWVADSIDRPQYEFVINGVVAYRTLEGLKKSLKNLPKDSSLTYKPDCDISESKPLSSTKELREFEEFCKSIKLKFVRVPSG